MRKASSSGRAEPVEMMWVSDSMRGQGVETPLSSSTITTLCIAVSTATPQVSPSPWRAWPSPRLKRAPSTLTPR